MTPAELLVLAFLELFPLPVCTVDLPQGAVGGYPCPRGDIGVDAGLTQSHRGLIACVRFFKV